MVPLRMALKFFYTEQELEAVNLKKFKIVKFLFLKFDFDFQLDGKNAGKIVRDDPEEDLYEGLGA